MGRLDKQTELMQDWTKDAERYENKCVGCGWHFYGNKGRRVCQWCALWPGWDRFWMVLLEAVGIVMPGRARIMGFTHHARLFGLLPCYYRDDGPAPMLEMKWQPLWLIEVPLRFLWCMVWVLSGKGEPQFGIMVGKQL